MTTSSLGSALGSALSGLRVAQKALDVTASNISNANTDGYTKKTLPLENVTADGIGIGVRFGEVKRYVDEAVQRDYRTQLTTESYFSTRESYLSRIIALQGSTDQESNISAKLGNLYDGFVALSNTPDSAAAQNAVVTQASTMARSLNNYSQKLLDMRNETQTAIKAEVHDLNASLENIASINAKIVGLQAAGRSTADLEDQRDALIKNVSTQMDVTYYKNGDGVLVLQSKDGQILADTAARPVSFGGVLLNYASAYPASADGIMLHDANGTYDLAKNPLGGKLGALLSLRDTEIPTYQAQVDELAHKMMTRLDDQGMKLFTDANGTIPANSAAAYTGIAGQIKVNTAIVNDPTLLQKGTGGGSVNAGSNAKIMDVINYAFGRTKDAGGTPNVAFNSTGLGAGGVSFNIINDANAGLLSFSTAILDSQAADYNNVKTTLTTEKQYTQEVQGRLLDSSAVNTDEEMGRMIVLQKSYAASAKMISALDELFKDLLNAI